MSIEKAAGGWNGLTFRYDDGTMEYHVIPINDLRPHEEEKTCWCRPTVEEGCIVTHNSMDRRELVERVN